MSGGAKGRAPLIEGAPARYAPPVAHVDALYRYPLKGFSPEPLAAMDLVAGRHVPGDRLIALEHGPSGFDPAAPAFTPKSRFAVLAALPDLARVRTRLGADGRLEAVFPGAEPLRLDLQSAADRRRLETGLEAFIGPEDLRGPIRLLEHPAHRFTDHPEGLVSAINLESLRDLSARLGVEIDPLRFRANLHLEGLPAWSELEWPAGAGLEVGEARLEVVGPIVRCLATHVDPKTGIRDLDLVPRLFGAFGHRLFGVYFRPSAGGRVLPGAPARALG